MSTLNAGRQLIKAALESGFTVSVHYEQDDDPEITRDGVEHLDALWSEATACDSATVFLYPDRVTSYHAGWAYLVHGNDPDETISDHSASGWVNDWAQATDYGQREWKQ